MTAEHSPDLYQLAETVTRLSEALAASERRRAATARMVRWGALVLSVLVGAVIYAASDWMKAYATQMSGFWDELEKKIAQQPPTLDNILMSLMSSEGMQGALVKVLQSASTVAAIETQSFVECVERRSQLPPAEQKKVLCFSRAAVEDLGEFFLDANGQLPQPPGPNASQQEQMAYAQKMMAATLLAGGQTVVDVAALVHRVRRDSDLLRNTVNDIGGVKDTLEAIEDELEIMNMALRGVPVMAGEMGVMNRQMSIMSYGVGSTMGRMGNIMPW